MNWSTTDILDLFQTLALVIGFFAAIYNLRELRREQKIENSIKITEGHREIWRIIIENESLVRLVEDDADPVSDPPTFAERLFVRFVALHYNAVIEAVTAQRLIVRPGLSEEVGAFFALPVARAAWSDVKRTQSPAVVSFIDEGIAIVDEKSEM